MDGRTDGWTEAIAISPTLFLKSMGIINFIRLLCLRSAELSKMFR